MAGKLRVSRIHRKKCGTPPNLIYS